MFETAECRTCDVKWRRDARSWAHQHVHETGHAVELHLGYDIRPDDWMDRLSAERLAEIEALRSTPDTVRGFSEQLQRKIKGEKPH